MKLNKPELKKFIYAAHNRGYALGDGVKDIKEKDHSTTIEFSLRKFSYKDNYFGGEPYGGREVVFYDGSPVWLMIYYGAVSTGYSQIKEVYSFLQQALKKEPLANPYRGPEKFNKGKWSYKNKWSGDIQNFSGKELIYAGSVLVYKSNYLGGMIDQREED